MRPQSSGEQAARDGSPSQVRLNPPSQRCAPGTLPHPRHPRPIQLTPRSSADPGQAPQEAMARKATAPGTAVLLVTANVESLFKDPENLLGKDQLRKDLGITVNVKLDRRQEKRRLQEDKEELQEHSEPRGSRSS